MKTVILLSGQARSFGGTTPPAYRNGLPNPRLEQPWARGTFLNQRWYLYRLLDDVEFFCSLADDEQAREVEPLLLKHYPREKVHVEIVKQPVLPEPPLESTYHSAYGITSPFQAILRDLWHRKRVWDFYLSLGKVDADLVVRLRPDLFFQTVRLTRWPGYGDCLVPFWGNYGGTADRFALLGPRAAGVYFNAFERVDALLAKGCPMHPETLTDAALYEAGIRVLRTLDTHFATLRRDGEIVFQRLEESVLGYLEAGVKAIDDTL